MLAFSRQQVLSPSVLNLNTVINDLWKMLPHLLGEDIETILSLDPGLGRVSADRGQVEQVIMNLAVNARDAMPQGGKLVVETLNVELNGSTVPKAADAPSGPCVMLAVSDIGVGMSPAVQAQIFDPFFSTKEMGKGTGLGLATVYGIVKQSSGSISVHSEPGKGSSFKVYLPRVQEKEREREKQDCQAPVQSPLELRLRAFFLFQRGVDCGVGADFVIVAVGPALDREILNIDSWHPTRAHHNLAKDVAVDGDSGAG